MNVTKFEEKITKRADEQTHDAIRKFRQAISVAFRELFQRQSLWDLDNIRAHPGGRACLANLADGGKTWPKALWDIRREALEKDIMASVDVVQRSLLSKGGDGSFVPDGSVPPPSE